MIDTKEFWNQIFSEGKKFRPLEGDELDSILEKAQQTIGHKIKRAADVGAGTGELALSLAQRNIDVTAFDISPVALGKAKELSFENYKDLITFQEFDLNKEKFASIYKNSFDVVFAKFILGLKSIESENLLDKLKELLTSEGILVIITPVLVKGQEYDERQKNISVQKEVFETILSSKFKLVETLFEKGEVSWPLIAYLCS
mgnify:CR=1 FL=1